VLEAVRLPVLTTARYLAALGATPALGRLLTATDDNPAATATAPVVLGYAWFHEGGQTPLLGPGARFARRHAQCYRTCSI